MIADLTITIAGVDPLTLAVGVGLSIIAGLLLDRPRVAVSDDAPTPLATRGAFAPYVRGIRRVGPIVALAGGRRSVKGSQRILGIKVSSGERTFFEHGLHVLALGPIYALHAIHRGGSRIFSGPITADTHPSGSTLTTSCGTARIYWGEQDQPVDSLLSSALGISSRFPLFCYVVWNDLELGPSPHWPQLDYVIEGRVQQTGLTDTIPEMGGTFVNEGPAEDIVSATDGSEGVGRFEINGYHLDRLEIGEEFDVAGNTASGTYTVFTSSYSTSTGRTSVFPNGGLSGSDSNGTLQPMESQGDDGVNLAHVIWEMLFADQPYGLKLDQSDWDIESLEALGTLIETEGIKGSVVGQQGETVEALLASILQDLGVQIPINLETGLIEFVAMRKPTGMLPNISSRLQAAPLPEREQFLGERPTDDIIFAFNDRELNFRKNTIEIDDLGQAHQLQHKRRREVPVESTVNFDSAALIANRRELEEFTSKSKIKVHGLRGVRTLKPGDAITVDGFDDVMRVWSNQVDPLSSECTLEVSEDFYGVDLDTFTNSRPGVDATTNPPAFDLAATVLEVPAGLLPSLPDQAIIVPRIRAHAGVSAALIHLSLDDVSYTLVGTESSESAGGTLDAELPATGRSHTDEITFTVLGPDIAEVLDLTADAASWRTGRQLMVIGDEIMFVRSITALGGGQYRANDVLRARYCTRKATHAAGSFVFILSEAELIRDPFIQPDATVFVKNQPTGGGVVALSAVDPIQKDLHGVGRKPGDVEGLGVIAPTANHRNEYSTTDDITVSWRVCLPITDLRGAGALPAGDPLIDSPVSATYRVEWLTTGDVVQRTDEVVDETEFTLTNGQLQAAFGSEPASFKVRSTNIGSGLASRSSEITINLV